MSNLLLHVCCAPCAEIPIRELQMQFEISLYFFNPNIHPAKEYVDRLGSVKDLAKEYGLPLMVDDYPYQEFLREALAHPVRNNKEKRCAYCYECRMQKTAEKAESLCFSYFSSSLLYSKYQDHHLLFEVAGRVGASFCHTAFLYRDFRPFFEEGKLISKNKGYYLQKYCGCIFSNEERYHSKMK